MLFGGSFFWWAFAGLTTPEDAWSVVRWSIAMLHCAAGLLIMFRMPQVMAGSWRHLAGCIPALISAGFVFSFAIPTDVWPLPIQIVFAVATGWTIVSLSYLGRSFAVFPSVREIVAHGPYQFVRHPAYLGELLMLICCVVVGWSNAWVFAAFAFALCTVVARIYIEERLLAQTDEYLAYRKAVRWRLIPFAW